jgi:hypothetical protein
VHATEHSPPAQIGAPLGHCELAVHDVPPEGWQAPFTQESPLGHWLALHEGTHAPSAQTSPEAHWLEYWQAFDAAVHAPPTQACPVAHSAFVVQAHGPSVPPQLGPASWPPSVVLPAPASVATQTCASQAKPVSQSAFVVHSTGVPGDVPGAVQYPDVQTVPWGQVALVLQPCSHPFVVHVSPLGQSFEPLQAVVPGAGTGAQEYPSHE